MSLTVHLIRHGATDALGVSLSGRTNAALNGVGAAQARALASRLAGETVDVLYSSPLERALRTAEPLAEAKGLAVEIAEPLNEIDLGDWTGARFEDLDHAPEWAFWNAGRSQHRAPNGESMLEVQARVARWLERIWRARGGGVVAAVSHADVIKAALAHALGLCLDHHARLEISPASLSTVVIGSWGLNVQRVNEVTPWSE
ncbi:histidine phosphatase family protein [uncultured Caulobacter sp.]|uniref:histidine phosphatase family protein n=1 Tax=uncultured Caulobacter sp. TaxID=158749 RepID=UPI00262DD085|nr:histidine phosphatase family protein [uncultured Caulobacter sp.]